MVKLWAKTIKDDKITRDFIFREYEQFDAKKLHGYLTEICHEFDIPTPLVLKTHITNFDSFNITRFKESDFVESVDFDALVLENVAE